MKARGCQEGLCGCNGSECMGGQPATMLYMYMCMYDYIAVFTRMMFTHPRIGTD